MASSGEPDVLVIGGGIVGLSTAYALTELGATVRVYERGVPGDGQSGGESRIFRHAHDDSPGQSSTPGTATPATAFGR